MAASEGRVSSWQRALIEAELAASNSVGVADRDLVARALRRQAERARERMKWYSLLYHDLKQYATRCETLADDLGMEIAQRVKPA